MQFTALMGLASKHLFPIEISIPLMKTLIETGANVNLRDDGGFTPLLISVLSENPPAVSLLIEAGADINCVCERGTLLDIVEEDIAQGKAHVRTALQLFGDKCEDEQNALRECQKVRQILRSCRHKRTSRNSASPSQGLNDGGSSREPGYRFVVIIALSGDKKLSRIDLVTVQPRIG